MARRPRVSPATCPEGGANPIVGPKPNDHRATIDLVCKASHPAWVDVAQLRRWLESHAELRNTELGKLQAVLDAAETIGFRFG